MIAAHQTDDGFSIYCREISSGFLIMTAALVIMNIVFIILCYATAVKSGFAMNILDFVQNSILYVLPNILMICCVYAVTALLFKNPLPAVPALVLYIIYSNMLDIGIAKDSVMQDHSLLWFDFRGIFLKRNCHIRYISINCFLWQHPYCSCL
mgnify:CR=1 FL=1